MNIYFWITMAGSAGVLFPLVGALLYRKRLDPAQAWLAILCLLSCATEALNYSLIASGKSNHPVTNVYILLEFLLLLTAFSFALKDYLPRLLFIGLALAFLSFATWDLLDAGGFRELQTNTMTLSRIVFIFLPLAYFSKLIREKSDARMEKDPLFWMCMGVLLYFGGTVLIFVFMKQLSVEAARNSAFALMYIHTFLNFLHYILYGIALWTRPKT